MLYLLYYPLLITLFIIIIVVKNFFLPIKSDDFVLLL